MNLIHKWLEGKHPAMRKGILAICFILMAVFYIAVFYILMVSFSGCTHKDLCFHHEHRVTLRLEFDWRDAPEADPLGMSVYLYPVTPDIGEQRLFNFNNTEGGEISVEPGLYHLITYNNDTEFASGFDTGDFHTHNLYTREGSLLEPLSFTRASRNEGLPRPTGTESEPVVVSPDALWGCTAIDVEITEQGVSYRCFPLEEKDDWAGRPPTVTEHVITLYPHDLLCLYTYEVRNVKGLENVENVCGALTGMSPALFVHDESLDRQCVTIPVEAHKNLEAAAIEGSFLTFGHHEENDSPHHFALYMTMRNGETRYVGDKENFNVTDQIHAAPDRRRVHFVIDGVEIEGGGVVPSGSGMQSSFDDWGEINEDLIVK